jgi:hypothetical protein
MNLENLLNLLRKLLAVTAVVQHVAGVLLDVLGPRRKP